jgi:hypothetical protein
MAASLGFDRRCCLGLGLGLAGVLSAVSPVLASGDGALCVVVGRDSRIGDLTLPALKNIFMSKRFEDAAGHHVTPLNQPPRSQYRVGMDQLLFGLGPDQVADFWIERKRRRLPGPPRSVPSLSTLRRVLARLPGTLGYLPRRQLTNQVRVLKIDGKYPEHPDYPLIVSAS